MFTIQVTEAEYQVIALAIGRMPERKRVRARAAKKVEPAPEPFNPATGNAELDEFMRAHHDPKYKPLPLPKGAPFPGTSPRPLAKVLEEAIGAAKRHGWPGSYTGNFAAPKRGRR